jgi:hypothetical protein
MKNILLSLIFLTFITFPERTFALIYDNKTNKQLSVGQKSDAGYTNEQGHFGINNSDFTNCKKLNANYSGLKQGKKIHYDKSNKLIAIENGIFDCAYNINNQPTFYLQEGLIEYHDRDSIILHYKIDGDKQFIYEKTNGVWFSYTKLKNYPAPAPTNYQQSTTVEIQNAEKLFIFYKNLDFSSRSAKIYGDKILNNSDSVVKKESTPKKNDWINKYNDNDIIPAGSGTGFFINRDGILLSNYHVIQGCASVSLYHNGVKYSSNIIASDRTNDIAIISSSKKSNQYFRVDKDGPSLLEEIFVAGYPLGLKVSNSLKVSSGRVSSLAGFGDNYANFQLDAAINPGNSGGPIINKKGNVVGIAVAYLPDAQGFNFGIKSSTVNSFVNSNKINFSSPNMSEMSTKELSKLMNEATVFIECSMKVKDIKAALEKRDTKKVFYSEFRN